MRGKGGGGFSVAPPAPAPPSPGRGPSASNEDSPLAKIRRRAAEVASKIQPFTQAAERVAGLAVQMRGTTSVMGAIGMVSAAVNAVNQTSGGPPTNDSSCGFHLMLPRDVALRALIRSGAIVQGRTNNEDGEDVQMLVEGRRFRITSHGMLVVPDQTESTMRWLRGIFDSELAPAVEIGVSRSPTNRYYCRPVAVAPLRSCRGDEVVAATRPMLADGKCRSILLTGRPGVGKTTMAHYVASQLGVGRVVVVSSDTGGDPDDSPATDPQALSMLSPGAIVIDDIDKLSLRLHYIERLRQQCGLLVMTANNGDHDEVIDGAQIRPERIDEIFEVLSDVAERRHPFGALSDEEWNEVRDWPVAYLNEVEARILRRPHDVRLDDLKGRLERRTRSKGALY